jgi:xanthine dehydrogenase accessory factor
VTDWLEALTQCRAEGISHVLVTLAECFGSTPREAGAKMVVTADDLAGSIGGGSLEFQAAADARGMLHDPTSVPRLQKAVLGPDMRQCCGGAVTLLFEPFRPETLVLALFGAGHVGQALVRALDGVPIRILWVDEREGTIPPMPTEGLTRLTTLNEPLAVAADLPAGAHAVVMTHSHERDFQLISVLARRHDLGSIGLIGSQSKWARFRHRLIAAGLSAEEIGRVRCPVGLPGLTGKRPAEIAIAIAAQLLLDAHKES